MHYDISKILGIFTLAAQSQVVVVGGNVIGIVFNPDIPSALPSYQSLRQKYRSTFRLVQG